MRAGRFEATCLVQARCTVTVVNLSWSVAAPVALRTMLPPMRSTMSELLAWAKEARCPDTDWRPPCDSHRQGSGPAPLGASVASVRPTEAGLLPHAAE